MAAIPNERKTILHVGFAHSGTTSLQENLFSRRPDFYYCGLPYGELGGIFSFIKYNSDRELDNDFIDRLSEEYIWSRARPDQTIVVSDETLTEQPEVYYTPQMQPSAVIANRLRRLFPNAVILFTIRNQFDYIVTSYLNLKRNYAHGAHRPIEDIDAWFAGNHTQVANLFLRNINFSQAIRDYAEVFGRKAISVVPLELLQRQGTKAYLDQLAAAIGIRISNEDISRFAEIRNRRMTVLEDSVATQWPDQRFRDTYEMLAATIGHDRLSSVMKSVESVKITLSAAHTDTVRRRAEAGNNFITAEFGLPLGDYGYPVSSGDVTKETDKRASDGTATTFFSRMFHKTRG
jgi:hypothetical protein